MVCGTHWLYGLRKGKPVLERIYQPALDLIGSLQSNRAFHSVEPITRKQGRDASRLIHVAHWPGPIHYFPQHGHDRVDNLISRRSRASGSASAGALSNSNRLMSQCSRS
jgi:hypothetical protein